MKKIAVFTLVMLTYALAITSAAVAASAPPVVDGPVARNKLERDVRELLYNKRYSELEKLANDLRTTKARFPEGHWKLYYFYHGLSTPKKKNEKEWQRLIDRLEKWQRAYPESVTARVVAGLAWLNYGWAARGDGYASSVTEEGWRLLRERSDKALSLASKAPADPSLDCPERYSLLLEVGRIKGWDRDTMLATLKEGIAFEPRYYSFYAYFMTYLSPRWSGQKGEWISFIEEADALAGRPGDHEIYARMVGGMWPDEWQSFDDLKISWTKVKAGYRSMEKEYPGAQYNLNHFVKYACIAGDLEVAQELFAKIGDAPYLDVWKEQGADFDKCRSMAEGGKTQGRLSKKEIRASGKNQEAIQMRQLAADGDAYSQYQLGINYRQGEWGKSDNVEAVKWMTLAAEKGLAEAQSFLGSLYGSGIGVQKDEKAAVRWYLKAALQGYDLAKLPLANALFTGKGVGKDFIMSYAWLANRTEKSGFESISETIWNSLNAVDRAAAEKETGVIRDILADCAESGYAECIQKHGSLLDKSLQGVGAPAPAMSANDLFEGVVWQKNGEAEANGGTLSIKNGGSLSTKLSFAKQSGNCLLVGARLRHSRPTATVTGAPAFMGALLERGSTKRPIGGVIVPAAEKEKNGVWWQTYPVPDGIDGAIVRFGTAGAQGDDKTGSVTQFQNVRMMLFRTCDEAKMAGEKIYSP